MEAHVCLYMWYIPIECCLMCIAWIYTIVIVTLKKKNDNIKKNTAWVVDACCVRKVRTLKSNAILNSFNLFLWNLYWGIA